MTHHIIPLGNRALIKLVKKPLTSTSGFILTTKDETEQAIGEIIALGGGQGTKENIIDLGLNLGDRVLIGKYSGDEVSDDTDTGAQYKIINSRDILAIIK